MASILPLGGIASKVTVLCNETGNLRSITVTSVGLTILKGAGMLIVREIAALGDSFTQGACVPVENNFVHLLQARSPLP